MGPLAAFQVLVLAMAAAVAIEALKPSYPAKVRLVFGGLFAVCGVVGIATTRVAAAWPAASSVMVWIGSSPVAFFFGLIGWLIWIQKPWASSGPSVVTPQTGHQPAPIGRRRDGVEEAEVSLFGLTNEIKICVKRIKELEESTGILRADVGKNAASVSDISSKIKHLPRLIEVANSILAERQRIATRDLCAHIHSMRREPTDPPRQGLSGHGDYEMAKNRMFGMFQALGVPRAEVEATMQQAAAKAQAIALNCTILPQDERVWKTPEAKLTWHIREAQHHALLDKAQQAGRKPVGIGEQI